MVTTKKTRAMDRNIPKGWDSPTLGDLFVFKNGLNKAKQYFGHGTPIVNYMDVYRNPGITSAKINGKVSVTKQEQKNFNVDKGDVFFTRTSETVDEIGIAAVVLDNVKDTVFSGFILRAQPKDDSLMDEFKKYCFATQEVRKQIMAKSSYTTRALTNGTVLSTVSILRPPKQEQRNIAEALTDIDNQIELLQMIIAKKQNLKRAAMQELLNGKTRLSGFREKWKATKLIEVGNYTKQ
jgi:type I restriction enzyme S subunit